MKLRQLPRWLLVRWDEYPHWFVLGAFVLGVIVGVWL